MALIPYRDLATYYAWIGDSEQTLAWLDRAFTMSPNAVDFRVIESGIFDKVRQDPSFRSELARIRSQVGVGFGVRTVRFLAFYSTRGTT